MTRKNAKAPIPVSKGQNQEAVAYKPTAADEAAVKRFASRRRAAPKMPRFKVSMTSAVPNISSRYGSEEHAQAHQMNAFGLIEGEQLNSLLKSMVNLTASVGVVSEEGLNEMATLVVGIGPQNPTEALLAVQMAAVHTASMTAALNLKHSTSPDRVSIHTKALNNLTRTFAMQAEAMKKLRSTGEQKVVVEHQHVHVYPGGQAVVGTLNQRGGGGVSEKIEGQSHERD